MSSVTRYEEEVEKNYKFNFRTNLLDGTFFWFGTSFIASQTIIPAFVSNLTPNPIAIGLVAAIASAGWFLPQLFTANWVQSLSIKKDVPVKIGFYSQRIPLLLLPLSAWLIIKSPNWALILFFILYAWQALGAGAISVAWQDMIAKVIPTDRRGRFLGLTNFGGTFTGMIGAIYSVKIIKNFVFPYNYMVSFGIAGVAILISWYFLSLTKEVKQVSTTPQINKKDYRALIGRIFKNDKNFSTYIYSRLLTLAGGVGLGFVAVFSKFSMQVTDNMIASFTISMLAGQALSNLFFGWLSDKKGHKIILEISNFAGIISIIIALIVNDPLWLHLSFILMGVNNAGFILSGIAIVFEFSEPEIRPTYIGIANTFSGVVTLITPLLGGWIAKTLGYPILFIGAICLWAVGWLVLKFIVKEPRGLKNIVLG